jgi:hypothetical protein
MGHADSIAHDQCLKRKRGSAAPQAKYLGRELGEIYGRKTVRFVFDLAGTV